MSLVHPLTIFFMLVGGAVLIPQLERRLSRSARALLILVVAALAFLLGLGVLRAAPLMVEVSSWAQLETSNEGIRFTVTPLAGRFLLLTLFSVLAVTLAALDEPWDGPTDDYKAVMLAVAAGLAAYVTADNFLSWLVAWLILDLMWLFAIGLPGQSRWPLRAGLLQGGGFFCLFVATVLVWQNYETMSFALPERPTTASYLVLGALVLRMGIYPLHLLTRSSDQVPERIRAIAPLVLVGATGYWLIRWIQLWGVAWLPAEVGIVIAVGLLASGLLAWRRQDATGRTTAITAWLALVVLWALWYERADMAAGMIWTGVLALAALAIHGGRGRRWEGALLPGIVAALALAGVPGSGVQDLGWLIGAAVAAGDAWLAAAGVVSIAGVSAALLHMLFMPTEAPHQRSRWTGMILLALAAWPAIGGLLWLQPTDVNGETMTEVPARIANGLQLLGWLGGILLWRMHHVLGDIAWLIDGAVDVLNVGWLWDWSARLIWSVVSVIRGIVRIIEGENYGWLLLFLLIAFFFLAQ